ncbi:MAG: cob(I)yrinic acid a,c-diamide adenosyltransferase [Candidatus Latescibacterota bacterium]|jgi:cob(I)alamin adenosyltransferase
MVTLSRIYTRTGDGGQTRLGDWSEVAKTDPRVEAYGSVDELNATLGLVLGAAGLEPEVHRVLSLVQHDLFDLGADLCRPIPEGEAEGAVLRVTAGQATRLEREIDRVNGSLEPLRSFVLPGGSPAAGWLHLARTVCRRTERRTWALAARERVNPQVMIYLNRLSDLLFVLARQANDQGKADRLWEPGLGRATPAG